MLKQFHYYPIFVFVTIQNIPMPLVVTESLNLISWCIIYMFDIVIISFRRKVKIHMIYKSTLENTYTGITTTVSGGRKLHHTCLKRQDSKHFKLNIQVNWHWKDFCFVFESSKLVWKSNNYTQPPQAITIPLFFTPGKCRQL